MPPRLGLRSEPLRVELLWIRKNVFVIVEADDGDVHLCSHRDGEVCAWKRVIPQASSELIGSRKFVNVWVFVKLIHRQMKTRNQLYKTQILHTQVGGYILLTLILFQPDSAKATGYNS